MSGLRRSKAPAARCNVDGKYFPDAADADPRNRGQLQAVASKAADLVIILQSARHLMFIFNCTRGCLIRMDAFGVFCDP